MLTKHIAMIFFFLIFSPLYATEKPTFTPSGLEWVDSVAQFLQQKEGQIPQPDQLVDALNRRAVKLYQDGKYHDAIELTQRTWQYAEKQLGEQHQKSLAALNNLGQLHETLGNYTKAEPHLQRALRVSEQVLGKEHPQTFSSSHALEAVKEPYLN